MINDPLTLDKALELGPFLGFIRTQED